MKTKMVVFSFLAVLLAMVATPVYADVAPTLPHAFYGVLEINGDPAPVGTLVEVRGEGVQTGVGTNPIEVIVEGEYGGGDDPMTPKLVVQGSIADGTMLTFYVNGFETEYTAVWHSGEVTEVDVSATIEEGAVPPPTTPPAPPPTNPAAPPPTNPPAPPPTDPPAPPDTGAPAPPDTGAPAPPDETVPGPPLPPSSSSDGSGGVPVLWLVIGGAVLVGLIITFWIARSKAY